MGSDMEHGHESVPTEMSHMSILEQPVLRRTIIGIFFLSRMDNAGFSSEAYNPTQRLDHVCGTRALL